MKTTRRAVVLAVLFGSIFVAGAAQAGDVKGKVSAEGLSFGSGHCCLHRRHSGQEIRSAGPARNS